jgi:hypothetical protein
VVEVDEFCAFLAAGAAIRKGTAKTVKRVDVNKAFISFLLVSGVFRSHLYFARLRGFTPSLYKGNLNPVFRG